MSFVVFSSDDPYHLEYFILLPSLQACVLFNIASLYTQLAAGVDRTSPEDIDEAIHLLEKAIGNCLTYTLIRFKHSLPFEPCRNVGVHQREVC